MSLKGEIIDNALWEYKNVVQLPLCEEKLEMFLTKIQAMKFQYLEILYLQKSVFFAKLCLLPLQELL